MSLDPLLPPFGLTDAAVVTSAVHTVITTAPPEDSGANTADRYEWQAAMAAAHGLALFAASLDEDIKVPATCNYRVICEWHEDWVNIVGDAAELVSCKHRDLEAGAYTTITKVVDDGGVAHLFERWTAMRERPQCRVVTSGAVAAGDARELFELATKLKDRRRTGVTLECDSDSTPIIDNLRSVMCACHAPVQKRWSGEDGTNPVPVAEQRLEVIRFLSMLRFDDKQPLRDHLDFLAPAKYAQPIIDLLGLTLSAASAWEAVMRLFRSRMRAKGPVAASSLIAIADYTPGSAADDLPESVRGITSRIVTMFDIEVAIRSAAALPAAYKPVPRLPLLTRLAMKMDNGGCSDNSIERAEHLRADYNEYWHSRASIDITARAEQQRFERRLLRLGDEAGDPGFTTGRLFWQRLQNAVDRIPTSSLPVGMDADLALGGLCELANRCKIWFSQRFDVDDAVEQTKLTFGMTS